ncbi:hypothetical protein GGS23DRAFT_546862 [Durotheca rogersii]|uniref:uncharacterized protein n=1 Tax=Durotheca rogersii TaxID=419775 RepID=UPI00221F6A2F|nr:uncharacterized protein GGS23DRAFT_546862 [Durotheca rogersii]KAI5868710.1 hypothetical protein GGS23DRAFT_546862 [Durotheca rogersii]
MDTEGFRPPGRPSMWFRLVKRHGLSNISIHSGQYCQSASQMGLEQFLPPRALPTEKKADKLWDNKRWSSRIAESKMAEAKQRLEG